MRSFRWSRVASRLSSLLFPLPERWRTVCAFLARRRSQGTTPRAADSLLVALASAMATLFCPACGEDPAKPARVTVPIAFRYPLVVPGDSLVSSRSHVANAHRVWLTSLRTGESRPWGSGTGVAWSKGGSPTVVESGSRLFTVDDAGSVMDMVPAPGEEQFFADWSPDGGALAFDVTYPESMSGVWAIEYNAGVWGEPWRLDRYGMHSRSPVWSPDGQQLAFIGFEVETNDGVYVVQRSGSGMTRVGGNGAVGERYPRWSPTGTQLLLGSPAGIRLLDLVEHSESELISTRDEGVVGIAAADWFSDGNRIVFTRECLWILDLKSGESRPIMACDY